MSAPFLPFLYQTRTLQRLSRPRILRTLLYTTSTRRSADHIPFELPPEVQRQRDREEAQETPRGRSTITPSERNTFDRIFEEIAARGRNPPDLSADSFEPPSDDQASSLHDLGPETAARPDKKPEFSTRGRDSINVIIQDAALSQSRRRPARPGMPRLHPLDTATSAADRQRALLRFPPSLRRAARLALGVIEPAERVGQDDVDWEDIDGPEDALPANEGQRLDTLARKVELEAMRSNERTRVEGLMKDAPTDFALWQVLEAEVFPMVGRLGLGESQPKPRRRRRLAGATAEGAADASPKEEARPKLSMDVHGPLYPSYLLYGLRLLDTSYSTSSPLALALLPRIKQGGLVSYVLGVSTPFYNSLMSICWHRHSDVHAVFALLEEMRHAGLYFDEASRAVLDSMEHYLASRARGSQGPFLQAVLAMPEYEAVLTTRLDHWKKVVWRSIQERKSDLGY